MDNFKWHYAKIIWLQIQLVNRINTFW